MPFRSRNTKAAKILNGVKALQIYRAFMVGETQGSLARRFGVSVVTVGRITRGESWQQATQRERNLQPSTEDIAVGAVEELGSIGIDTVPPLMDEAEARASAERVIALVKERQQQPVSDSDVDVSGHENPEGYVALIERMNAQLRKDKEAKDEPPRDK